MIHRDEAVEPLRQILDFDNVHRSVPLPCPALEYWNDGMLGTGGYGLLTPVFQYSIVPFARPLIPTFQKARDPVYPFGFIVRPRNRMVPERMSRIRKRKG
jgi:hypothetical protein